MMMHPPPMIAELMLRSVGEAKAHIRFRIKNLTSRRACKAGQIASIPEPHLTCVKVNLAVGNVRNDSPDLVQPVG
jgi:hypothetical protein